MTMMMVMMVTTRTLWSPRVEEDGAEDRCEYNMNDLNCLNHKSDEGVTYISNFTFTFIIFLALNLGPMVLTFVLIQ